MSGPAGGGTTVTPNELIANQFNPSMVTVNYTSNNDVAAKASLKGNMTGKAAEIFSPFDAYEVSMQFGEVIGIEFSAESNEIVVSSHNESTRLLVTSLENSSKKRAEHLHQLVAINLAKSRCSTININPI